MTITIQTDTEIHKDFEDIDERDKLKKAFKDELKIKPLLKVKKKRVRKRRRF